MEKWYPRVELFGTSYPRSQTTMFASRLFFSNFFFLFNPPRSLELLKIRLLLSLYPPASSLAHYLFVINFNLPPSLLPFEPERDSILFHYRTMERIYESRWGERSCYHCTSNGTLGIVRRIFAFSIFWFEEKKRKFQYR